MIRRHPHVFGDEEGRIKSAEDVLNQWDKIKAEEKEKRGIKTDQTKLFKQLPPQLPALLYALDIYKRAKKLSLEEAGIGLSKKLMISLLI